MRVNLSNGSLDITVGFAYTRADLFAYLIRIKAEPVKYHVPPQYINAPGGGGIAYEIDKLLRLAYTCYPMNLNNCQKLIVKCRDQNATYEVSQTHIPACHYDGVELPLNTVYDSLGWIMSTANANQAPASTARNYYLPLLALYAKWCRLLGPNDNNAMVHIAWFNDTAVPHRVLLGSTIGVPNLDSVNTTMSVRRSENLAKATNTARERQHYLNDVARLQCPPGSSEISEQGLSQGGNYGCCAETFFFIYAATKKVPVDKIQGFAMTPQAKHGAADNVYTELAAATALRDPCPEACQKLCTQLGGNWQNMLKVLELRRACGAKV
ncbi:MAG: hypothetical protein Q9227_009104 [Pyrenula ochraceoflavens]